MMTNNLWFLAATWNYTRKIWSVDTMKIREKRLTYAYAFEPSVESHFERGPQGIYFFHALS